MRTTPEPPNPPLYNDPPNPTPKRGQPSGEPNVPISEMYGKNGPFPRGVTMLYGAETRCEWRREKEELRAKQLLMEESGELESYRHAAETHRIVRQWARTWIKPGMKYIDIADGIENKCRELLQQNGYERGMAFPCGLSFNHIAAHWAPNKDDTTVLKKDDVVKVDFGTQVNGSIIDCAWTFSFDDTFKPLMDAVKEATYTGIKWLGPDVALSEVGEAIQEVMESHEVTINGRTYPSILSFFLSFFL